MNNVFLDIARKNRIENATYLNQSLFVIRSYKKIIVL